MLSECCQGGNHRRRCKRSCFDESVQDVIVVAGLGKRAAQRSLMGDSLSEVRRVA